MSDTGTGNATNDDDGATDGGPPSTGGVTEDGDDGSDGPTLGPCAQYIECVMEATPQAITTAIATYGDEGTCWSLPGVTEENCWTECKADTEAMHEAYPDVAACWECRIDDDCPADAAFCDDEFHTCADWECRNDTDCPPNAQHCTLAHTCADDPLVYCGDSISCVHGVPENVQSTCDMLGTQALPGECPIRDAIGICVTPQGTVFTIYSEKYEGQAESYCDMLGGRWMPL